MDALVRNAIARIEVGDEGRSKSRGTGCLIADGLVLTALHVVADREKNPPLPHPGTIFLQFPEGVVEAAIYDSYFDPHSDWVLLTCLNTVSARPIPLANLGRSGGDFVTYGFPDSQPVDGMIQTGTVENHKALLNGIDAIQLFSKQAAGGEGAPVKGLSGAPMIVDNAIVGVLRFALMKDDQAVAGTLYACPIAAIIDKCADFLPIPDPCWGLPGLQRRPLPVKPFRYLQYFDEQDAEIFFGRNREIRSLYSRVIAEDASPITLLYGQSGVGKSSFLAAGLLPRLAWHYEILYVRRDQYDTLSGSIRRALIQLTADPASANSQPHSSVSDPLPAVWSAAETDARKPIVILLDQVEEVFTRPTENQPDELVELVQVLKHMFSNGNPSSRNRIIFSFRKEWYPEVQKVFESSDVGFGKVFLEALDHEAVIEIVAGLHSTVRLRQHYGLTIDPAVPALVANDLLRDRESPTAPALQILLTKMWEAATESNNSAPAFTIELYHDVKKCGLLLADFVDRQLGQLAAHHRDAVDTGFVLNLLVYHTTPMMTAAARSEDELHRTYCNHRYDLDALIERCKSLYLLVDSSNDQMAGKKVTRLAHDTLALPVRCRFDESDLPGPRARRILGNRSMEWKDDRVGAVLDRADLAIVEAGASGLGVLMPHEKRLVAASKIERKRRDRVRQMLHMGLAAAVVGMVIMTGLAWTGMHEAVKKAHEAREAKVDAERDKNTALAERRKAEEEKQTAQRRFKEALIRKEAAEMPEKLSKEPALALANAVALVGKSEDQFDRVLHGIQHGLSSAVEVAREKNAIWFPKLGGINSIAFSPDGHTVACGGIKPVIQQVMLDGTVVNKNFTGHEEGVESVVYTPDGCHIVSGGAAGTVCFWTTEGVEVWCEPVPNRKYVTAVAISSDGTRILSGCWDGSIQLWDANGASLRLPKEAHHAVIHQISFNPDGTSFASASGDGKIHIFQFEDESLTSIDGHAGSVNAVVFNPAGDMLVSGGDDGTVRLWHLDGSAAKEPFTHHGGAVTSLVVHSNGERIVSAGDDRAIRFIDFEGNNVAPDFTGYVGNVESLGYHPNGTFIAFGTDQGTLKFLDPEGIMVGKPIEAHDAAVNAVAYSPDGDAFFSAGQGGTIRRWSAATHRPGWNVEVRSGSISSLAIHPDGTVLVSGGIDEYLRFWTAGGKSDGDPLSGHYAPITCIAFSPDGNLVASGSADQQVRLWDVDTRQCVSDLVGHSGVITAVAFHPQGDRIATCSDDLTVRLWDLDGNLLQTTSDLYSTPTSLAFNPAGHILLSGTENGFILSWHLDTNTNLVSEKRAHNGPITALAFSPDGSRIASTGVDGVARLWGRGMELISDVLADYRAATFTSLAFSADGKYLIVGSSDNQIWHWRVDWRDWLEIACNRLQYEFKYRSEKSQLMRDASKVCKRCLWKTVPIDQQSVVARHVD